MEKEFQRFIEGLKINPSLMNSSQKKMLANGILVIEDRQIKINPVIKKCKTYFNAKAKLSSVIDGWLENMSHEKNIQQNFRFNMVEYFKNNPIGELYSRSGVMYADFPNDCPSEYKNGSGKMYVYNGHAISAHFGFDYPTNAPKGCDVFTFEADGIAFRLS